MGFSLQKPRTGIHIGTLCAPIIVYPGGGWEQDLPKPLLDRLQIDRLANNMLCLKGDASWEEVCDTEALLYMYPRTMEEPLSEHWTRIYLYLGTKVMQNVPDDIKMETLNDYDMRTLIDLKRWIRQKKVATRKDRDKCIGEQQTCKTNDKPLQMAFSFEN